MTTGGDTTMQARGTTLDLDTPTRICLAMSASALETMAGFCASVKTG